MLDVGDKLKGRYLINAFIKEGGMGAVYEAHDQLYDRIVAIKESFFPGDDKLRQQFEREARLLARLDHPALPEVYDYFSEGIRQFLVMRYIEGEDLEKRLKRENKPLPLDEVLEWAEVILDALVYLHSQNPPVVHRDIKPANLKLDGDGSIFLLDFGLAKSEASSVGVGTMMYAPPEQVFSRGTTARSDLYSFGQTLYHLLTDKEPWTAHLREGLIVRGQPDPQLLIDAANPKVSRAIAEAIAKAAAVDPADRYVGAAEMREALRKASGAVYASVKSPLQVFEFTTVTLNDRGEEIERRKGQAYQFIEDLGRGVKLEMVYVPDGKFVMGSNENDREKPPHNVTVPAFYLGKYQVTQAQWRVIAEAKDLKVELDLNLEPSRFKGDDRLPVEQVSWKEAVEFCARVAKKTGGAYRLPSEAEWEYACRAGTTTPFAFGETITPDIVNYNGKYPYGSAPKGVYRQQTVAVGSLGVANAFGLFDMHGNVWEWCEDDWHDSYSNAPTDGQAWVGTPSRGSTRVDRGGGWSNDAVGCRSASRDRSAPAYRHGYLGFRLLRTYR